MQPFPENVAVDNPRSDASLSDSPQTVGNVVEVTEILHQLRQTYLGDSRPWIVGFSGGKDSSCLCQLVFKMLMDLPQDLRKKEVHVISSDTLVESPLIERRLSLVHSQMSSFAKEMNLPIRVQMLRPTLQDSFWVNLIGRGYPSPNRWFRWCTDRLKINPSTRYITEQVRRNGEVVILLGARKNESASRAQTLGEYAIAESRMRRHTTLLGAFVYTPLEDFDSKEVWATLLSMPPPWGGTNRDLVQFYRKADRECPLVLDTTTPSCGGSRFGCWTCTVVEKDRAVEGLIEDGETWLQPLLDFRDWLKQIRDDPRAREETQKSQKKRKIYAMRNGKAFEAPEHRGHKILGPFTIETRHKILRRLMETQEKLGKEDSRLITQEELAAIQTLWIYEGDSPRAVEKIAGKYMSKNGRSISTLAKEKDDLGYLLQLCEKEEVPLQLLETLLAVERDLSGLSRRRDLYSRLEKVLEEHIMSELASGGI
jgi:DNA sulfur modification protein DndC